MVVCMLFAGLLVDELEWATGEVDAVEAAEQRVKLLFRQVVPDCRRKGASVVDEVDVVLPAEVLPAEVLRVLVVSRRESWDSDDWDLSL